MSDDNLANEFADAEILTVGANAGTPEPMTGADIMALLKRHTKEVENISVNVGGGDRPESGLF